AETRAETDREPMIVFDGVEKRFGDHVVLRELSFTVAPAEHVCLIGPSGSGKTTILRLLMTLEKVDGGTIRVGGQCLSHMERKGVMVPADDKHCREVRKRIGMVFQQFNLFPNMTVRGNLVEAPTRVLGLSTDEADARAVELLELVGLAEKIDAHPTQLSGGQQQRVALARALVIEPSVLLLDEPLSNLDAKLREELRDEIRDIQRRLGITAIFVTHDQVEALTMSDRVAIMHRGRVEQVGSPREIYEYPATPFVAGFIGRTNRIPATVETVTADQSIVVAGGQRFSIPMRLPEGARVTAMIRPHRMRISEAPEFPPPGLNGLKASINRITFAGEAITYEADLAGIKLAVETQTGARGVISHQPGDLVWVEWPADETLIFEPA
ncbi:MAG: ABC transporter ATP-binding protein, partial [Steroidobacteraceae bacterium]